MSDTLISFPTFAVPLPEIQLPKVDREYRAFLRMLPDLLKTHRGQYVAVHEGQVVDGDIDDIALIKRVHAKIGYVPIHVGLVVQPQPVERIPYFRELRSGADRA